MGSSSISSSVLAVSTGTWNITSGDSTAKAEDNPMTFYTSNGSWASTKTAYDPCPAGWRVPEGGDNGVWAKALGKTKDVKVPSDYTNKGINYTGAFGGDETIWYPASGCRDHYGDGRLCNVGDSGSYWSASSAYSLHFSLNGYFNLSSSNSHTFGLSVRCLQE